MLFQETLSDQNSVSKSLTDVSFCIFSPPSRTPSADVLNTSEYSS